MTPDMEINPCAQRECAGACCTDAFFGNMSRDDFEKIVPPGTEAIEVPSVSLSGFKTRVDVRRQNYASPRKGTTIYFSSNNTPAQEPRYEVLIDGICPNLTTEGDCGIYDNRPQPCRDYTVGDTECMMARVTSRLGGPIFLGNILKRPEL